MTTAATAALERLLEAYRSPGPLDTPTEPVIGYVGQDVPEEILTAAGARALRLRGSPGWDTGRADTYLGTGLDPAVRALLAGLLDQRFGPLAGVVVSSDCDASQRLFYVMREIHRVEPGTALPPVHLVDVLHLPRPSTLRYNVTRLRQLQAVVEEWTGRRVTAQQLAAAVTAHNAERRGYREMAALRRSHPPRLSGQEALAVLGVKGRLPLGELVTLLTDLAGGEGLPERAGRRVFVTGSSHDSTGVYREIERRGAVVVGEDHDHGELHVGADVREATLEALAERYRDNGPTPHRASMQERAEHTAAAVGLAGAELLLSYARERDDAPAWDVPHQAAAVGVRTATLTAQPYGAVDPAALEQALTGNQPAEQEARA